MHTANTKTFNVKDGAYTSANETIMSSEFESYLGDLQKTITKSLRSGGKLLAKDFDIDKIKKYFAYQCMHDLRVMEGIQEQQEKLSKIPGFPVDYLERSENTYEMRNTYISREPEERLFQNAFRNYALAVAIDPTSRLVGSNCIVTLSENGGYDTLGIALSPNAIFILTERYDKYPLLHYTLFAWKTLSQRDVDFTNQRTLKTSILRGAKLLFLTLRNIYRSWLTVLIRHHQIIPEIFASLIIQHPLMVFLPKLSVKLAKFRILLLAPIPALIVKHY